MFYVYKIKDKFIKIVENKEWTEGESMFKIKRTEIENASYWTNKKHAKSYQKMITKKFSDVELVEAKLTYICHL
jgi:hypothetical protein